MSLFLLRWDSFLFFRWTFSTLWQCINSAYLHISWCYGSWTVNIYGQLISAMNGGFKWIWLIQALVNHLEGVFKHGRSVLGTIFVLYFSSHHKWGWVFQGWHLTTDPAWCQIWSSDETSPHVYPSWDVSPWQNWCAVLRWALKSLVVIQCCIFIFSVCLACF